jgi:hypothetical protein
MVGMEATQIALRFPQRAFGSRQRTKQSEAKPNSINVERTGLNILNICDREDVEIPNNY